MGLLKQNHQNWMKKALDEARKAFEKKEIPVGAVIVHENEIIGRGYNQREKLEDPTAHAEILSITSAATHLNNWRLEDCSMYVTLEPCAMCAGAILNARIPKLYFGAYDKENGMCGSRDNLLDRNIMNHSVTYRGGLLEKESKDLLEQFFAKVREE